MKTSHHQEQIGCTACGHVEEPSPVSDQMARFGNSDDRTDRCLRQVGIHVPIGTEVPLCRQHGVMLEQALTIEYRTAAPYVRPLPHTPPTVGVETRPRRAMLTTWVGDEFMPLATLGPVFRLFGQHKAHRVGVEFGGRRFEGIWLPDCQDFVRLRAIGSDYDA